MKKKLAAFYAECVSVMAFTGPSYPTNPLGTGYNQLDLEYAIQQLLWKLLRS